MHHDKTSAEGNAHIVPMPAYSTSIGVAKFLIAFVALVLTAATATIWGNFAAFGFTIFTCVLTLVIGGYYRVALGYRPILYNRWAVFTLEASGVLSWLISLSLLAQWTANYNHSIYWSGDSTAYSPFDGADKIRRNIISRDSLHQYHAGVILAVMATGLCAIEFLLFVTTLVVFSINLHKHQLPEYPSVYGEPQIGSMTTTTEALDQKVKASEEHEMTDVDLSDRGEGGHIEEPKD